MEYPTLELLARESEEAACSAATKAQWVNFEDYMECTKFDAVLRHVEGLTDTVFKVACVLAKHAEDLETTAEIWRRVTKTCDGVLECIAKFTDSIPNVAEAIHMIASSIGGTKPRNASIFIHSVPLAK